MQMYILLLADTPRKTALKEQNQFIQPECLIRRWFFRAWRHNLTMCVDVVVVVTVYGATQVCMRLETKEERDPKVNIKKVKFHSSQHNRVESSRRVIIESSHRRIV